MRHPVFFSSFFSALCDCYTFISSLFSPFLVRVYLLYNSLDFVGQVFYGFCVTVVRETLSLIFWGIL